MTAGDREGPPRKTKKARGLLLAGLVLSLTWVGPGIEARAQSAGDPAAIQRGAQIFAAAGCGGCHTDRKNNGPLLAGGRALETPFGTFYPPNITADPTYGIGKWSDADFTRALREGLSPDGDYYYPAFPYTSYTQMTEPDMLDLKAYIFSLPTAAVANREHDLGFPFSWRDLLGFWRWMNFEAAAPIQSTPMSRGEYLVRALGHCGECHTPRDWLGGSDLDAFLAGTDDGPEGATVPNITPDPETGIGRWSSEQVVRLLTDGQLPNFDYVGGDMGEVVNFSTGPMAEADRQAIANYLLALPPIANTDAKATQP